VARRITLVFLTLLGALVRILELQRPMGSDESASWIYYASKPMVIGLTIYGSPNNHPLHTVLMHISGALFGDAEWALRLPALIAGVLMIPLTYVVGRAIDERGALIAAALTATWPALIDYSTDGRGYTLLCCFTLIAAASMVELARSGNTTAAMIFALAAALGFFTVPVMLYPFVALLVWGMSRSAYRKRIAIAAAGAIGLTILFYLPMLMVSGPHALLANPYVQPLPLGAFIRALPSYAVSVWSSMTAGLPIIIPIMIAVGFIGAVTRLRVAQAILPALTVAILLLLQRVLPFPRVWLPFLPLVFVIACAWSWTPRAELALSIVAAIALSILAIGKPRLRDTGELRAVHAITRELKRRSRAGDVVLALPPSEMPLAFYAARDGVPAEILRPDLRHARRIFVIENRDYGQSLEKTLRYFQLVPRAVRKDRDFGSAALYEVR
jgi:4-amino-4-deoxy-L-arabinose transferase-like glycosyltransferase